MPTSVVEVIQGFFDEQGREESEQREQPRQRFFRPARVIAQGIAHRAFTRDISAGGVGLMHDDDLATGPVQVEIELRTGASVTIGAELLWCRRHGQQYLSGARFLEPVS